MLEIHCATFKSLQSIYRLLTQIQRLSTLNNLLQHLKLQQKDKIQHSTSGSSLLHFSALSTYYSAFSILSQYISEPALQQPEN